MQTEEVSSSLRTEPGMQQVSNKCQWGGGAGPARGLSPTGLLAETP